MRTKKILMDDKHITMPNGVCLASNVHKGWYAIAWYDKNAGKISTMWENKKTLKKMQKEQKELSKDRTFYNRAKKVIAFLIVLDLVLIPVAFFPFLSLLYITFYWPFLLCPLSILHFALSAFLMTAEEKKYHGALHMLLNSWCKGISVNYVRSLKLYSHFYSCCYTGILINIIILCFFIPYILYSGFDVLSCSFAILTLYLFLWALRRLGVFNIFQRFTTFPPTEQELRVVLAASKLLLEKEEN